MPDGNMVAELIATYGQGVKLPEIAKKAGLKYERVRNIAYGRVKEVTDSEAEKIASVLGIPARRDELPRLVERPMARLQVVGATSAGPGEGDHPDEFPVYVPQSMVTDLSRGWVVEGDSMSPWLLAGDVVIVTPHRGPRLNYPMLVRNPENEVMVKMVVQDGNAIVLRSLNNSYADVPATVEFIGYVTGRYRAAGGYELAESDLSGLRP